eukprot:CAMPEP_0172444096 /NCGR_PEP_ID=MMETSP1065-20121228/4209_1 /TAXON_ID=265537 /ORGANISM="Amphiprora paludosa, Strain CCMP125" /LENGTH=480 /DNA_ID=CAMNT_0013194515 /DNA_START=82 /DNA_END=1524 /DNA_ORIENTATION=+
MARKHNVSLWTLVLLLVAVLSVNVVTAGPTPAPRGGSTRTSLRSSSSSSLSTPSTATSKSFLSFGQFKKNPKSSPPVPDSVTQLARDVQTVLEDLRSEKYDPTVSASFQGTTLPTFAITWNHDLWERHNSRWRMIAYFLFWPQSALFRAVQPQLWTLLLWTTLVVLVQSPVTSFPPFLAPVLTPLFASLQWTQKVSVPMTSLGLISSFVASLLALRTNQGMARLLEARQAFGKVVLYTRDMASVVRHFIYDKDPQLALKLARHLATFSWLLKHFLRGTKMSLGNKDEDIIHTMIGQYQPEDAHYIQRQRKPPVAVLMRLRQALTQLEQDHLLSTAEALAMDHLISHMDLAIMTTERIVASPIPPLFTTHGCRFMVLYLMILPLALKSQLQGAGLFLTVGVVGYAMLGLEEISHLMEQPFRVAPLYHLCKNSMTDVANAFCLAPPDNLSTGRLHDETRYVPEVEPTTYAKPGQGFFVEDNY